MPIFLSAFSLSIAILNILLNTIPSVIDKAEEIKNLEARFNRYLETLENCRMSLDIWVGRWKQDNISDYQALFGRIGWLSIQERRYRIEHLLYNVLRHLKLVPLAASTTELSPIKKLATMLLKPRIRDDGSSESSGRSSIASGMSLAEPTAVEPITASSIEAWQVYVRESQSITDLSAPPKKPDVTVVKRIIGILYANRQLDREIDELQKAIDRLHEFSRNCFYKMGHGRLGQEPQEEAVNDSLHLDRLQKIAGELHKSYLHRKELDQWMLELRVPQEIDGGNSVVKERARNGMLYFTVNHRSALTVCYLEGALRPKTPGDPLDLAMKRILSEPSLTAEFQGSASLELSQAGNPTIWTKSLRFLLIKSRESRQVQKIFSLERARVAYGCALWMILLWKIEWFANLCSCGFRSAVYDSQPDLLMAPTVNENEDDDATRPEYSFRSLSRANNKHPCPRRYSHANKLYLLGILLAELYLSEAIDLDLVDGRLEPSNSHHFKSNLDIVKRMKECAEFGGMHSVRGAVKFCLMNAGKKEWMRSQESLTKFQVDSLIDEVLVP